MSHKIKNEDNSSILGEICCINYMIVGGSIKSFGVLYTELLDYYGSGAGNTAWISSVCLLLLMGLGPLSNYLGEKFSYRIVIIVGGFLMLVGFTISAFITRMELLYLTYGVIAGLGYGLVFSSNMTIVSFYFKKRRSLANGLMVSFSGIGNLAFPSMYRYLIDQYGLQGALMIIGAILSHICPASMFLRQPEQILKKSKTEEEIALIGKEIVNPPFRILKDVSKRICKLDLFRIPKYTILLFAISLQVTNYVGNLVALPGQIRTLNMGKETIVLSVSLVGASEMITRALLGWFADLNIVKRTVLFMIGSLASAIIAFVIPHFPNKPAILTYAVLMGMFSGSMWSLMGVLIVDCVGIVKFSPAFGLVLMVCGIFMGIGQPVTGWIEDITGDWAMSFRYIGLLSILSFLLCLCEPCIERWWCCHKDPKPEKENLEINDEETNVLIISK